MNTLEGIPINGLILKRGFGKKKSIIAQTSAGGTQIIYEKDLYFQSIDLVGGENIGALKYQTLLKLEDLALDTNAFYTLIYGSRMYKVRFRTEDVPVIDSEQVGTRTDFDNEDYHKNITIKLVEVQ